MISLYSSIYWQFILSLFYCLSKNILLPKSITLFTHAAAICRTLFYYLISALVSYFTRMNFLFIQNGFALPDSIIRFLETIALLFTKKLAVLCKQKQKLFCGIWDLFWQCSDFKKIFKKNYLPDHRCKKRRKPSSDITCLDWINLDMCHRLDQHFL